jgi:hypothetical protein
MSVEQIKALHNLSLEEEMLGARSTASIRKIAAGNRGG